MRIKNDSSTHPDILGSAVRAPDDEPHFTAFRSWRRRLGYLSILTALPAVLGWYITEARAREVISPTVPAPTAGENERRQATTVKNYSKPELLQSQTNFLLPHQKEKFDLIASFTSGGDDCPGLSVPIGSYTAATPFIDTRDTTGANDTITSFIDYCYIGYCNTHDTKGPDIAYSFTLTARGAAPEIRVTPTSATFDPLIVIVDTENGYSYGNPGCPSGIGAQVRGYFDRFINSAGPGGSEVISGEVMNSLPLNKRLFLFVDSAAPNSGGPYQLTMKDVSVTSGPAQFDFDRDTMADVSVYRPSGGYWYRAVGWDNFTGIPFGLPNDRLVPADYDGDQKADIAIYRDGIWWWIASSDNTVHAYPFGISTDIPVPADYTGDGRAELAVYRDGIWWTFDQVDNKVTAFKWGLATDKPVPGDYDGDGLTDYAVYRDGIWYINGSMQGFKSLMWGLPTDKLVPADYDGDGKTDPAIYRDGDWWILRSGSGIQSLRLGTATDIPVPADYDGDGSADFVYYRDGAWDLLFSTEGLWYPRVQRIRLGLAGDKPIPAAYIR